MNGPNNENVEKDLRFAIALSLIEGICFFMAGFCALMAGNILGYISGGLLVALACASLFAVFAGGKKFFLNMGISLVEDETAEECDARMEEEDGK